MECHYTINEVRPICLGVLRSLLCQGFMPQGYLLEEAQIAKMWAVLTDSL